MEQAKTETGAVRICWKTVENYQAWLVEQEKSPNTVEKYLRDVKRFYQFLPENKIIDKQRALGWKESLCASYSTRSVNSMLIAVNDFLRYAGLGDFCVKPVKLQRSMFCPKEKELSKAEYKRLVEAAKNNGNQRLSLLIETICSVGIRVSEVRYITVEAAKAGRAEINCKGKRRVIFLPKGLRRPLLQYAKRRGISGGCIFCTKSGRPLDRSNIWHDMKKLCKAANVEACKVFPHNLRHLFARTFYALDKDIAKLADILGHSSIETTRIYTISSGAEHARKMERLGLLC